MLANLLHVAGVKHVVTVDLHASQMQGFFQCPVDNLHAEPLIARWIRHNVPNWREAVVVSKNAGGTKRVTSLADALKLNFGMVTTDKKRGSAMTASMLLNDELSIQSMVDGSAQNGQGGSAHESDPFTPESARNRTSQIMSDAQGSPRRVNGHSSRTANSSRSPFVRPRTATSQSSAIDELDEETETDDPEYNDQRAQEVTHGRLLRGHIVPDDFPSPATSVADASIPEDDPMTMSHASSFFNPEPHALGGSGEEGDNSDDDEEIITNSKVEHMITLVGDVKNRIVLIVDDMIDKPGSWIAAAETVAKRGLAKKVYCIATHGIFGGDCLEQMQACDCIDAIVVTNSYPVPENRQRASSKLVLLDLSFLLGEAIRRNHYGESISPLFQHIVD
jgi:ribose-phosphate pyrophosphokinase